MARGTRKTTEDFIKQSIQIHGTKFDYSLVNYKNTHTKVKIICPVHGEFEQLPMDHIKGNGCGWCSGKGVALKQENFLDKMKQIHIDKGTPDYDYSFVIYKNLDTKIKIICKEHGEFLITPRSVLLQQAGCSSCGRQRTINSHLKSQQTFIEQANKIHNNKYDYTKSIYNTSSAKLIISCPIHGDFDQRPDTHITQKSGCPHCANELKGGLGGYTFDYFENNPNQKDIPATLYVMNIINNKEHFIKIGITAKTVQHRFNRGEYKNMIIDTLYEKSMTLFEAFSIEQLLLEELKSFKFFSNSKFSGYTECFQYKPEVIVRIQEVFKM